MNEQNYTCVGIGRDDEGLGFLVEADVCCHYVEQHKAYMVLFRKPTSSHPRDNYLDAILGVSNYGDVTKFFTRVRNLECGGGGSSEYFEVWGDRDPMIMFLLATAWFDTHYKLQTFYFRICVERFHFEGTFFADDFDRLIEQSRSLALSDSGLRYLIKYLEGEARHFRTRFDEKADRPVAEAQA